MNQRKKIKICQCHFANIDAEQLCKFEQKTGIINIISFIKKNAYDDFGMHLTDKDSLETFDVLLKEAMYKDKTEWLREKMRNELKKHIKRDK